MEHVKENGRGTSLFQVVGPQPQTNTSRYPGLDGGGFLFRGDPYSVELA